MAEALSLARKAQRAAKKASPDMKNGPLADPKGLAAAGIALAALPVAIEGMSKLAGPKVGRKVSEVGEQAKQKAKEQVAEKADELTPDMPKKLFGNGGIVGKLFGGDDHDGEGGIGKLFGGGDDGDGDGAGEGSAAPGHGSGRRMPIQQSVDVAVPIKVAYDQWTQFEEWPRFMHRLDSVDQVDESTVAFSAKVWGVNKRFEAKILEQRPEERIEWDVSQGLAHIGVVTFHELSQRLTRIEVTLDVEPDSLVEKAARGMRFIKRAARGDLHRFKAYVELNEEAEDGWRGTIEHGDVKRRKQSSSGSNGNRSRGGNRSKSNGSSGRSRARSASK
jgi:uncharacterized membrane protein